MRVAEGALGNRVDSSLPESRRGRSEYLILMILVVAGAVITWLRVPSPHHGYVWAEDGNLFLSEAVNRGPWSVLFNGYAGYQHLVPRLVVAVILPITDLAAFPVIVFAICAVITGLVAGAVFWLSRDLVPWLPGRVVLGLITLLIPLDTQEVIGNLADIHTYAMWLMPWLLLYRPQRWLTSAGWAVVTFLTVMTEVQSVFFFFLILFRLRNSERLARPLFGAFALGALIQIVTVLTGNRQTSNGPLSLESTVIGWMINTVIPLVVADPDVVRQMILRFGLLPAVIILIPLTAAIIVAIRWGSGRQRLMVAALFLGSAAVYTGSAWANSDVYFEYAEVGLANMGNLLVNVRYGVSSGLLLAGIVPIAAGVWFAGYGRSGSDEPRRGQHQSVSSARWPSDARPPSPFVTLLIFGAPRCAGSWRIAPRPALPRTSNCPSRRCGSRR